MIVCMIAWQLQNFAWCFLTPENAKLLYAMWIFGGVVSAGFILGLFNIQLRIIPPAAKTLAISINLAVTSLVTAIAPILGGSILQYLLNTGTEPLSVYHQLFIVPPAVAILGCGLLRRVKEPNSAPLSIVIGAMRNARTLGGIIGLTQLANFIFVKSSKAWGRPSTHSPVISSGKEP